MRLVPMEFWKNTKMNSSEYKDFQKRKPPCKIQSFICCFVCAKNCVWPPCNFYSIGRLIATMQKI